MEHGVDSQETECAGIAALPNETFYDRSVLYRLVSICMLNPVGKIQRYNIDKFDSASGCHTTFGSVDSTVVTDYIVYSTASRVARLGDSLI